ncbi:sensor histidine kinase [Pseudomonas poae]|uniref:histidine kinase n=1 Tax=Pseudomonas poae TaxID=200451 RepID=A0A2S9E8Y3_9PSED|nr:ATP-binding protein [Pseudomonas poae]PRA23110.1 PAS domain-containing sensor histidine kinase [Pseudomonas poae]PRC11323.1 PAS domain-containing sensor histidine kinase [Pseudomonas poae]
MKISVPASLRREHSWFTGLWDRLFFTPRQSRTRAAFGISPTPLVNALGWVVGLVVACGIFVINSETHTDWAPTLLYITLLLMAANLFSINVVIGVALFSIALLTALFLYNGNYERWDAITGFFRCLTALSAITFLALRSKYAADSLRHNEAYLTGAQRLSQTGSVSFRGDSEQMSWSEELARIFEYPHQQAPTAAMVLERTHPDDRHLARDVFDKALNRAPLIEVKHRLLMPDGRIKHIHMIASPSETRGRFEYLGAVKDISADKLAEEALFHAQSQLAHVTRITSLGELAASIAHEVNQPLTAITSSGEACRRWLDRPVPDLEEARQSLDRIVSSACRASEVISRIRALSRKCDPLRKPESLDAIVNETLSLVHHELSRHKVRTRVELSVLDARINADRVQLQQVLINLIINACHAMETVAPRQRLLRVRTWVEGDEAFLEVADQGVGIDEKDLPTLFQPFFTTKPDGLGMGLSICRSIIDFHGGRLWATSTLGQGTSFTCAVPLLAKETP